MIELTEQQAQAIAASREVPPIVMDPTTKTAYVLLRQEEYEKIMDLKAKQRPSGEIHQHGN